MEGKLLHLLVFQARKKPSKPCFKRPKQENQYLSCFSGKQTRQTYTTLKLKHLSLETVDSQSCKQYLTQPSNRNASKSSVCIRNNESLRRSKLAEIEHTHEKSPYSLLFLEDFIYK